MLGILVYLVVVVVRSRQEAAQATADEPPPPQPPPEEPAAEPAAARSSVGALKASFTAGLKRLKSYITTRDYRYDVPWIVRLGQVGSRPQDLLATAGLGLPVGRPAEEGPSELGCGWWLLDGGLVIDLAGDYVLRADSQTADDRGWRAFLRLLEHHRPERPIDGLLLTIPASDLYGVYQGSPEHVAEIQQKATALYRRVWDAQRKLNFRFPIYVLVTGCERVPGFTSFFSEVPEDLRRGMFGWSSPYAVDQGYRREWVDEAFAGLEERLDLLQLGILGQSDVREPDRVFLFPTEFRRIWDPLRIFLDHLFKPSAYHEPMLLRGVYFCGASREAELPAVERLDWSEGTAVGRRLELPTEPTETGETYFVKDLLERKIFPEARLAAPAEGTFIARNRRVRWAQALVVLAAAVLAGGLWLGYSRLGERERVLRPFLRDTANDLVDFRSLQEEVRARGEQRSRLEDALLQNWAYGLIGHLNDIDARPFKSAFIPSSWLSSFDSDLGAAFTQAYSEIIFQALKLHLEHRAETLIASRFGIASPATGAGTSALSEGPIAELPQAVQLASYLNGLRELEAAAAEFNDLQKSQDLEALARVIEYAFGKSLQAGFFNRSAIYRKAMRDAVYDRFEAEPFRPRAVARARELYQALFRRLYDEGALVTTLEELDRELNRLDRRSWAFSDESEVFSRVVDLTTQVERLLSQPSLEWAFRTSFDLGPEFEDLLASTERSDFMVPATPGRRLAEEMKQLGEAGWIDYRRRISSFGSPITGPLLQQRDGQSEMQLSQDALLLKTALRDFLGQEFMVPAAGAELATRMPSGARLEWDLNLLDEAAGLVEPYRRFRERGLPVFPSRLRPTLDAVARRRLGRSITGLVARAQRFQRIPEGLTPLLLEGELAKQIERLQTASEPLDRILGELEELRLNDAEAALSGVMVSQGFDLLEAVDQLLEDGSPYQPRGGGFEWWDGEGPVGLEAFGVEAPEELQAYLELQRARISRLARDFALPLILSIGKRAGARQPGFRTLVARWDAITRQLTEFDEKKPGNSVARLEELVGTTLPVVELDNCFERVSAGTSGGADFFLGRMDRLREALVARCTTLAGRRAVASYGRLESFFRLRLADKYPFADPTTTIYPREADPETVREFFELYDELAGYVQGVPTGSPAFRGRGRQVQGFVRAMSRVRAFFSAFLEAEPPVPAPVFDVEVAFRVHRELEEKEGANQIIHWQLDVGDRQPPIVHPDPQPKRRWTLGEDLRLALRWAEGSQWRPVSDPERPEIQVDGREVVYQFTNNWSLLSFLATDYATAEGEPHTLRFRLDTRRTFVDEEGEEREEKGRATVLIRLALVAPESELPVVLPAFPAVAPRLPDRSAEIGRRGSQ